MKRRIHAGVLPTDDAPKLCARCSETPVPSPRHTYCEPCAVLQRKTRTREKDDKKRAGCLRCGGDKGYGRGSRYCEPCRLEMLPIWKQAEIERSQRRPRKPYKRGPGPNPLKRWDAPEGTKWCPRCEKYLPFEKFGPRRDRGRLSSYCALCTSEYGWERQLATLYGITIADYDAMLEAQGGRCAICQKTPRARRLAVDHNHKTGQIRGLLCTRCNHKLLGSCGENSEILRRAADYLDHFVRVSEDQTARSA